MIVALLHRLLSAVVWVLQAGCALIISCLLGGLAGFLLSWLALGQPLNQAWVLSIIGMIGGIVATPMLFPSVFGNSRSPDTLPEPAAGELHAHAPGAARSRATRFLAALVVGSILLPALSAAAWEWYVWSRLDADGRPIQAWVTQKRWRSNWRSSWSVTYEFNLAGQRYSGIQEVSRETDQRLQNGDVVAVRYLRADPSISRLEGDTAYRQFLTRMAAVALAVSVLLMGTVVCVEARETGQVIEEIPGTRSVQKPSNYCGACH